MKDESSAIAKQATREERRLRRGAYFYERERLLAGTYSIFPVVEEGAHHPSAERITKDAILIATRLGISVPEIRIKPQKKKGAVYYQNFNTIVLHGGGYSRVELVHEMLHHLGVRHTQGYRSRQDEDILSPAVERLIFGSEEGSVTSD